MAKEDKLFISRYNDFYGALLTKHQCEMIKLYYDCDISLFEIAEQFNISRQAVRDAIKRAEAQLTAYEEALHAVDRNKRAKHLTEVITSRLEAGEISEAKTALAKLLTVLEENNGSI